MKKVLLVLPLAIMLANCNTTRSTTRTDSSGTNASTASTDMNTGTSGSASNSSSGTGSAGTTADGSSTGNASTSTAGTSGNTSGTGTAGTTGVASATGTGSSGTSGTSGSAGMTGSGTTNSSGSSMSGSASGTAGSSGSTSGNAGNWNNNNTSNMQTPGSMASDVYDPNNYMQNPEKYKRPDELGKTGGWTYNTDWRRNRNFNADAAGEWTLMPSPEVAANWITDTSRPETYAAYWTEEAVAARDQARMAAANATRDSLAMIEQANAIATGGKNARRGGRTGATTGSGSTGAIGSGGTSTMSSNNSSTSTSGSTTAGDNAGATGATGSGTTSGNMAGSSDMAAQGSTTGSGTTGSTGDNLTAVNGNKFLMPRINLHLGNGSFTGYTGCNNIVGMVKAEGNQLHFEDALPSTNIQCIGGFDQAAFLDRLRRADSYDVTNNQLHIKQGNEVLLVLTKNAL